LKVKFQFFHGEQGRANESGPMSLVIVECHI
jgi:hypothetical protein